jgi:hypothetical protein
MEITSRCGARIVGNAVRSCVEKQGPDASKIEALKTSALVLARQIDEIRRWSTNELNHLLAG